MQNACHLVDVTCFTMFLNLSFFCFFSFPFLPFAPSPPPLLLLLFYCFSLPSYYCHDRVSVCIFVCQQWLKSYNLQALFSSIFIRLGEVTTYITKMNISPTIVGQRSYGVMRGYSLKLLTNNFLALFHCILCDVI